MHLILIDTNSGYIWGDTRDLAGYDASYAAALRDMDAAAKYAAATLDRDVGTEADEYKIDNRGAPDSYNIYRVDINGSEALPLVGDGQDQETINAVKRECAYVATVRRVYHI